MKRYSKSFSVLIMLLGLTVPFSCKKRTGLHMLSLPKSCIRVLVIPVHSCGGCKDMCLKFAADCTPPNQEIAFVATGFFGNYKELSYLREDYQITDLTVDSLDYLVNFTDYGTQYPFLIKIEKGGRIKESISLNVTNIERILQELTAYCF